MISVKFFVVFSTLAAIASARMIATTTDGKQCITVCKNWCRPSFNEWAECSNTPGRAADYYTSMKRTTQPRCQSDCIKVEGSYRCLTDVDKKEWDYCSPYAGVSVAENKCTGGCRKQGNSYMCETRGKHELCSPAPTEYFKSNIVAGKICRKPKTSHETLRLHRRGHDYFLRSTVGSRIDFGHYYDINQLVQRSERVNTVGTTNEPNRPQVTYSTSRHDGVDVLRSMRARLNRFNVPETGFSRGGHPDGYQDRMSQLNHQQGVDHVGHMIALSLGGPNDLVNIVPQHAITNANRGRTETSFSYWRMTEDFIRWLARLPGTNYVDFNLYLFYEGNLNEVANRRPVGFGFRYIAHFTNGEIMDSSDCTFQNSYLDDPVLED